MYDKIKRFYDMGLYTAAQVHAFVDKGIITEDQYREICESNRRGASLDMTPTAPEASQKI